MTQTRLYYRFRLRDAGDTTDVLVVSSFPSDTNPYLSDVPGGDGPAIDIAGGTVQLGAITLRLVDAPTGGASRVFTALLADAAGKPWLLGRKMIVEESTDGAAWSSYFLGYLKRLRLVTAIGWELTVGDVQRAESAYQIFSTLTTAFPKGVNIIGEPITGGWGPIAAIGQTLFKVTVVNAARVTLRYQSGPLPPDYLARASGNEQHYRAVIAIALPFLAPTSYQGSNPYWFPRIALQVKNPTTGALVGTFAPVAHPAGGILAGQYSFGVDGMSMMNGLGEILLAWPAGGPVAQPSVNAIYSIVGGPLDVSTLNPLHLEGHPVDLETAAMTEAGIPWSAAAASTLKDTLGQTLRVRLRIAAGGALSDVMARLLRGPLGYGVRVAADGTRELVAFRDLPTALPGTTIAVTDLRSSEGVIYDSEDASVIAQVNWKLHEFVTWSAARDGGTAPNDLIVDRPITYQVVNGDAGALSGKTQGYEVSGHFYDSRGAGAFPALDFFAAQGQRLFDRFGRGGVRSEVQLLRGINPAIGAFVMLNLPHLPVAIQGASPVSQRGQGLRVVQVERSRPSPQGPILTVLDAGRNAQPSVTPTVTIAAGASDPKHYAEVTVTNVAALLAAGVDLVRFQMATGVGTPVGGIDFASRTIAQLGVTTVLPLPKTAAGETVWVRAQAKDTQQFLPSPWTAWTSVALAALTAPSGITQSAGANDTERVIRWALAANEGRVVVRWKLTGNFDWQKVVSFLPGTVEYTITDLIPGGGGVTVEVLVIDDAPSPGASAVASVTFTPGSTSPTLPVPWSPAGWAGPQDDLSSVAAGVADGSFGIDVTAAQWPAYVEVEIAVETGIGAGTYGAFVTGANPLVLQGYRTRSRFTFWAPNDRLRRQIRARHALPGYTASAYTATVTVAPWTPQKALLPAITGTVFGVSGSVQGTYESPSAFLLVQYTPPTNPHFDYVKYRVRQRQIGASTWGTQTYVTGQRDGDDFIPVRFGVEAEVRMDVVNTDGVVDTSATPIVALTPKFPQAELLKFDVQAPTGLSVPAAWEDGATGETRVGREPARLLLPFVPNEHCVALRVFSAEQTTPPADRLNLNDGRVPEIDTVVTPSLAKVGYVLQVGTCYVLALPLAAAANYRLLTLVPYDRLGREGSILNFKVQGDVTALPAAPSAASNTSLPAFGAIAPQVVTNSVTPGSSTLQVRAYRNGKWEGDFGPWTVGVPHAITHPAVSGQVDRWEYCTADTSAPGPRESARTAAFATTTPTLTLKGPALLLIDRTGDSTPPSPKYAVVRGINWSYQNPENAVGIFRRATSGAGPWTEVATMQPYQQGLTYAPGTGTWYFSILFRDPFAKWLDSAATAAVGPYPYP